jgi:hypothetical protein
MIFELFFCIALKKIKKNALKLENYENSFYLCYQIIQIKKMKQSCQSTYFGRFSFYFWTKVNGTAYM